LNWSWSSFWDFLLSPYLLRGACTTVWLTVAAMSIGLLVGSAAALMKMAANPLLRWVASFYIWLWRATPLLVQLVILYTGLPQIGIRLNVVECALIGFGLNEAAYLAELIRAGIRSIDRGQVEAAKALGMNFAKTMRIVVLPQAARVIVPPLGNQFNGMLKISSLASVVTMQELLRSAQQLAQLEFRVLEAYVAAAVYYIALTTLWGEIQRRIEAALDRPFRVS
jgi:polar amino acid transport system permease protein